MVSSPNKIVVYVGDITEYLGVSAKKADPSACLISSDNYSNLVPGTYYVSLGDLSEINQLAAVFRQADEIIYLPPEIWSDQIFAESKMKTWTEDYLDVFSCDANKKVVGFSVPCDDLVPMTRLQDQRKRQGRQIWTAGCSISNGAGVTLDQRYGNLIAKKMGLEVSFLTRNGSSILWAADQLLRSDLRSGDIVFWGITSIGRLTYYKESERQTVTGGIHNWEDHKDHLKMFIKKEFLVSDISIYQSVSAVMQVVNFCDKMDVQLVLGGMLRGIEHYVKHLPCFVPLAGLHGRALEDMFLDIGDDDIHPGPVTHQWYADQFLAKYDQIYRKVG